MDSLHAALDLSRISPIEVHIALLDPGLAATVQLLLRHTPLVGLLNDLYNLSPATLEASQREALQGIARSAIARHTYTSALFANLTCAIAAPSLEIAVDCLKDLPLEDASLAFEMLAFAAELLAAAELPDKAAFTFHIALAVAARFGLLRNRAIILNMLGAFERKRGRLSAAEDALREASTLFARTDCAAVRGNNMLRAMIFAERLRFEDDLSAPDDLEGLIASDAEIAGIVLPVLASKAVDRDDFTAAENLVQQLHTILGADAPPRAAILLLEARLARRLGRFEIAQMLMAQVEKTEDAERYRVEVLREKLHFARDFNQPDEAERIRAELERMAPSAQLLYNEAISQCQNGAVDEARKLFIACLDSPIDDTIRASCFGMLGQIEKVEADQMRYLYCAIGLFLKLRRKLDHAISLSNLARMELQRAALRKQRGDPLGIIDEFNRADRLFQAAQQMTATLGATPLVKSMVLDRARLESMRGRHRVALRCFDAAATYVEHGYLALSDRKQAEHFFNQNSELYNRAVLCATEAGRPRDALLFTERGKARLLLRDATEIAFDRGAVSEGEQALLAAIRPLRARLIQGRPLSAHERNTLHDAQARLAALRTDLVKGRAMGWDELRPQIFGVPAPPMPSEPDEELAAIPAEGVLSCPRCMVYNAIGASFCSACELPQVPTSQQNNPTDDSKLTDASSNGAAGFVLADELSARAIHQEYFFLHALSGLEAGSAHLAAAAFQMVKSLQFGGSYPVWTLPVSPGALEQAMNLLINDPTRAASVLEDLMQGCASGAPRRAGVPA